MVAASHIAAGAAIGAACPRARIAVPAAFVSHFVLDQVPHSCLNMLPASAWTALGLAIDGAIIVWVAGLAWRLRARWVALAAGVAAFLPDPLSYMSPIKDWFALVPGSWVVPWVHTTFHCDVTRTYPVVGFATQVVVVALAVYIVARRRHVGSAKSQASS